eukprot:5558913-Amphidinium_carterae.1
MHGKRTGDTLALPAAKAKTVPGMPLSEVDALASSVAERVGKSLSDEIAKLGTQMHSMSERLVHKMDDLSERVDSHDKELAEVKRIATAAREEVATLASRPPPTTTTTTTTAGAAAALSSELDPLKFVVGSFADLSRRDTLTRMTRELMETLGKAEAITKIEAPKRGKVAFVWFKLSDLGREVSELLREKQLPSPAGRSYWCSLSKAPDQVQRSSTLARATHVIKTHLDNGAYSTETLDIMWRQGQVACGRSIIAQLRGDTMEIVAEGWKKEFGELPPPSLS